VKKPIFVRLTPAQDFALRSLAEEQGTTLGAAIGWLIDRYADPLSDHHPLRAKEAATDRYLLTGRL